MQLFFHGSWLTQFRGGGGAIHPHPTLSLSDCPPRAGGPPGGGAAAPQYSLTTLLKETLDLALDGVL
jgi:hypothetical protein